MADDLPFPEISRNGKPLDSDEILLYSWRAFVGLVIP
jgi:hypothetical protein